MFGHTKSFPSRDLSLNAQTVSGYRQEEINPIGIPVYVTLEVRV